MHAGAFVFVRFFLCPFASSSPVHEMPICRICHLRYWIYTERMYAISSTRYVQRVQRNRQILHQRLWQRRNEGKEEREKIGWERERERWWRQINHRQLHKGVIWNWQKNCEQNEFTYERTKKKKRIQILENARHDSVHFMHNIHCTNATTKYIYIVHLCISTIWMRHILQSFYVLHNNTTFTEAFNLRN